MIKKSFILLSISATFYLQAQDVSTIRNTVDIYSNSQNTGSARYNAMAGSMGALGGDISAINDNPATLGVFITGNISGTLNITNSKNDVSLAGKNLSYAINKTNLGQAGAVVVFEASGNPDWKFVNIAFNYSNKSIEDYIETPGNSNIVLVDQNETDNNLTFKGHAYDRYGNVSKMNIALAANYKNQLYLGGSLNFHSASIQQNDTALFASDKYNITESYSKQYTPYSEESNGFSAIFGVIGKLNNQLRLGASLETPTWWTINRSYNLYTYQTGTSNNIYIDKSEYTEDRKLSSPLKATISGAFVPNKNFAINVDYTIGLTKPKYKVLGDAEKELNTFFNSNAKNLSEIKIGAEYRMNGVRLRGGYGQLMSPFSSISLNTYSDAGVVGKTSYDNLFLGSRKTIGAGIGYDFKSFYIDLAYQNVQSEYKNPSLNGFETSTPDKFTIYTGYFSNYIDVTHPESVVSTVKNIQNNISLTIGWKF